MSQVRIKGGVVVCVDSGVATAGGNATLTDSTKGWGATGDILAGFLVKLIGGTGIGQIRQIASHTATVLTVSLAWTTNPSTDSQYLISPK